MTTAVVVLFILTAGELALLFGAFNYLHYLEDRIKEKPKDKPADELSDKEIDTLRQVAEVMGYMGNIGHEDQNQTK